MRRLKQTICAIALGPGLCACGDRFATASSDETPGSNTTIVETTGVTLANSTLDSSMPTMGETANVAEATAEITSTATDGGTVGTACQPLSTEPCYTGPPETIGLGGCVRGFKTCDETGAGYGPCEDEVTPVAEACDTLEDDDCDGTALDVDAGCICTPGEEKLCYSGPADTIGVGLCHGGTTVCDASGIMFGACNGEVLPGVEDCGEPVDVNCDGKNSVCPAKAQWALRLGDDDEQQARGVAVYGKDTFLTGWMYGTVNFGLGPLSSTGSADVFLAKFGPTGDPLWAKRFGDEDGQRAVATAVDAAGNVAILGDFAGTIDFGGGELASAGSGDIFLAKFDGAGKLLWNKSFGGPKIEFAEAVAFAPNGDLVLTGAITSPTNFGGALLIPVGDADAIVAKFSANGDHIWSRRFGDMQSQGGVGIAVTPEEKIVMSGHFSGSIDLGGGDLASGGQNDVYLASFDSAGAHLWSKRFGDAAEQSGGVVAVDAKSGAIALTGYFAGTIDFGDTTLSSSGGWDMYIAVFGADGTHSWSRNFGDVADQEGFAVTFDAEGNVLVSGGFYGTMDFGEELLTSAGDRDIFIAKFSALGDFMFGQRGGDEAFQSSWAIASDSMSEILVAGSFDGNLSIGGKKLVSAGNQDIFLAKLIQ